MKKIPTLFERIFKNHKVVGITDYLTDLSFEDVLSGKCTATVKFDGSCCAIINGTFYKRFDAKKGKKAPDGAIPCCDPDPITGHHPHWVAVDPSAPGDKWFNEALIATFGDENPEDGTYEAVGKHFNGNPYGLECDILVRHGELVIPKEEVGTYPLMPIDFANFFYNNDIEGIVFWKDGEPICKIKRSDFGIPWPGPDAHDTYQAGWSKWKSEEE